MAERFARFYRGSYESVFDSTVQAMVASGFRVKSADPGTGKIVASAGISMMSYGETIIAVVIQQPNGVAVDVSSSAVGLTDWGKSKENIGKIFMALDSLLVHPPWDAYGGAPQRGPPPMDGRTGAMASADPSYDPRSTSSGYGDGYREPAATVYEDTSPLVWPVVLIVVNAVIVFILAIFNYSMFLPIGYIVGIFGIILLVAAALIAVGAYGAGAALALVGGFATIPLGILSVMAGFKALSEHRARSAARRMRY
jgi:hypothetical protein